jgi:2-succinyl-6-hydroxy-2,4-cyclohexadiene-1-carboxylate synthase
VHRLSYTTSGPGEHAILFLHGFMGSSDDWREVIDGTDGLDDRFRAVAVDLPGHGGSTSLPETSYSMEGAAGAVLRTLDGLGARRASLVGYSMGGRLALYLALRHPERCERLLLESASPGLKTGEERALRRQDDEERAKTLETGDFGTFLEEWYSQPLFSTLRPPLVRDLVERRRGNDPGELARSLRGMGTGSQPSLWEEIEGLSVPTLAVAGELDEKFSEVAREMEERSPRVRVEVVPGAGHNARIEAPEEYSLLLGGFISGIAAG